MANTFQETQIFHARIAKPGATDYGELVNVMNVAAAAETKTTRVASGVTQRARLFVVVVRVPE